MDPNATIAEIYAANRALHDREITGAEHSEIVEERLTALREWRAAGGFAPRDGWPAFL